MLATRVVNAPVSASYSLSMISLDKRISKYSSLAIASNPSHKAQGEIRSPNNAQATSYPA